MYPVGYGQSFMNMAQLESRYGPGAPIPPHPAYWRRIKAWLQSRNGQIGIGGAYRFEQPAKPGFAPPGKSFHEKQRFASGFEGYAAIDLVARNGDNKHRAPTWAEVPRQGTAHPDIVRFGLHCNVNNEPWHIQCYEMDGWESWANAGRKDPQGDYPLPGTPPPPTTTNYHPAPQPTLREGSAGGEVKDLQGQLNFWGWGGGPADGKFGSQTKAGVINMQKALKISSDGVYGPKSAGTLKSFILYMQTVDKDVVEPCLYFVRSGDSPWAAAQRLFNSGNAWSRYFTEDQFRVANVHIPVKRTKGKTTTVKSGEGPYAILDRMGIDRSRLDEFYDWNGSSARTLHPGDAVYMPL
jgi:hypothetical protein